MCRVKTTYSWQFIKTTVMRANNQRCGKHGAAGACATPTD